MFKKGQVLRCINESFLDNNRILPYVTVDHKLPWSKDIYACFGVDRFTGNKIPGIYLNTNDLEHLFEEQEKEEIMAVYPKPGQVTFVETVEEASKNPQTGINQILAERGSRYGSFDEHARITQTMKQALCSGKSWAKMTNAQKEALEMVAHKMGRIVNGDPTYQDSWTDIIGYAKLVEETL